MSIMRNVMMRDPLMGKQNLYNRGGPIYRVAGGLSEAVGEGFSQAIANSTPTATSRSRWTPPPGAGDSPWENESWPGKDQATEVAPLPTPGTPTIPNLPGVDAHENLNESIAGAGPTISADMTPEEINEAYINWAADPSNIPDYYGGATVAEFDPLQLEAFAKKEATAGQLDELNKQQLDYYQGILAGNSPHLQRAADRAAGSTANTFFGAGTPGSSRGQYAANLAAQEAQFGLQQDAISGISGVQDRLTQGADLLGSIGQERRDYVQNVINEDIKRWNFAQLAPQQQWDRLLGLANQLKGMELGTLVDSGGNNIPAWKQILASAAGGGGADSSIVDNILNFLNNEGGYIGTAAEYRQAGGIMGDPMMEEPMMQDPMMDQLGGPEIDPMLQEATQAGPMMEPQGIMKPDSMAPTGDVGITEMDVSMVSEEPMSEIDKAEGILQGLAAASGGALTIKRKTKGGK